MENNYDDIIVSSRVRLARNLSGYVFPIKFKNESQPNEIIALIFDVLKNFENYKVKDLDNILLQSLKEKHLISEDLAQNYDYGALSISHDEQICVMINEEEHIREQCLLKGLSLSEALERLNEVDDNLLENLDIAYSEKLGFLTTCPSNLGTGMRASVMMFLPALCLYGEIEDLMKSLSKNGITFRGNYGENSNADGFLFQISNSQTLGLTENEIIELVTNNVLKICEKERLAREKIKKSNSIELIDRIFRAYGILKNCYKITSDEAIKLLSQVKFGICLNIIDCVKIENIDTMLENVLPYSLIDISGENLEGIERDIYRAKYISKNI